METKENKKSADSSTYLDLNITPIEEPEEGAFSAYANVVNMDWTLYDLRIRFGELHMDTGLVPPEPSPSHQRLAIAMCTSASSWPDCRPLSGRRVDGFGSMHPSMHLSVALAISASLRAAQSAVSAMTRRVIPWGQGTG